MEQKKVMAPVNEEPRIEDDFDIFMGGSGAQSAPQVE